MVNHRGRQAILALLVLLAVAGWTSPAIAGPLVIVPTYNFACMPSKYTQCEVKCAFGKAATQLGNEFCFVGRTPTVHFCVDWSSTALGSNKPNAFLFKYTPCFFHFCCGFCLKISCGIRCVMLRDYAARPTTITTQAAANLPATFGKCCIVELTAANLTALGFPQGCTSCGTIFFSDRNGGCGCINNCISFSFTPCSTPAGQFDFFGTAEHEMSEELGRITFLACCPPPHLFTNCIFRFSAPGVRCDKAKGAGGKCVYLSVNNGTTSLVKFNGLTSGDLDDYKGCRLGNPCPCPACNPADPFNAFLSAGQTTTLSTVDLDNMEALGFELKPAVIPAPEIDPRTGRTASLLLLAALGLAESRRRRSASQA